MGAAGDGDTPGRPHMGYLLSGPDGDLGVTAGAAVCPSLRRPGLDQRTLATMLIFLRAGSFLITGRVAITGRPHRL